MSGSERKCAGVCADRRGSECENRQENDKNPLFQLLSLLLPVSLLLLSLSLFLLRILVFKTYVDRFCTCDAENVFNTIFEKRLIQVVAYLHH